MIFLTLALVTVSNVASAQQGYEFEVYDTDIGPKGSTEIEASSNYVASGVGESDEGLFATNHALRTSLEFTRTLSDWLQMSGYVTANTRPDHAVSYVGNRLKLTAVAPATGSLPLSLGVATEVSYARPGFAEYKWAVELTPIVAKSFGGISLAFNPAFERGLSGSGVHHIEIEPRGRIALGFGDDASVAVEYYAGLGGINEHYSRAEQRHQVFARFETEVASQLEFGVGLGRGLTRSSDRWVVVVSAEYQSKR